MVGDRKFDIEGANKNGIKGVGVSYGYGTSTELTNAGAFAVAKSAVELKEILYSLRLKGESYGKIDC
jgi:phosphoglycolate phosphatase